MQTAVQAIESCSCSRAGTSAEYLFEAVPVESKLCQGCDLTGMCLVIKLLTPAQRRTCSSSSKGLVVTCQPWTACRWWVRCWMLRLQTSL